MLTVKLLIDSTYYDISSIVKYDLTYSDDISKELDIASFAIPVCKSDSISGLDLSIPLQQLTKVEINIEGDIKRYYVREDLCETISFNTPRLYAHKVSLIEPTKLLELKPVPDFTVTQPQGTYTIASSQLDIDPSTYEVGEEYISLTANTENNVVLLNTTVPTDTAVIDEATLKLSNTDYTIYSTIGIGIPSKFVDSSDRTFIIRYKIDGVTVETKTETLTPTFKSTNYQFTLVIKSFIYTTTTTNQVLTITIEPTDVFPQSSRYNTASTFITTKIEAVDSPVWYYDEVVDKVLISEKVQDLNDTLFSAEFTFNDNSRNAVKNIVSPEFTFEGRTVWEILEEMGGVIKAIPRLSKDTWNEITFEFVDELNREEWVNTNKTSEQQQLILEKFSNSLEVNANNMIESIEDQAIKIEPYNDGWMTLRSDTEGPNQLTDTSVGLKVRSNIYRTKTIYAKGFTVTYSDATSDGPSTIWDIGDYVVEEQKWNALPNLAYDSGAERAVVNLGKGNTIYYSKETQRYVSFGYRAPKPTSVSAAPDQAIYQIIAAVATQVTGKTVTGVNGGQSFTDLLNTQYQVWYTAFKNVRLKQYKHNARDYEIDTALFSNEKARVNDNVRLGTYTQSLINRSGNKSQPEGGFTTDYTLVPKVGNIVNTDQIITRTNVVLQNGLFIYDILGYEKWSEISNFVGIKSEYRQYEIPDKDIVERNLVYEEYFTMGKELKGLSHTALVSSALSLLVAPFTGLGTSKVTYHQMKTRNSILNPGDAGWTTFDQEVEGPVDIVSLGTTTAFLLTNKDNYSVDNNVEEKETGGSPSKWFQNNVTYKNVFGQYDSARYKLFIEGANSNSVTDGNVYPEISDTSVVSEIFEADIRVRADARETINFTYAIPFFAGLNAGVEDFRVYNGIAKYNGFAIEDSKAEITAVLLLDGYFPEVEEVKIQPTKYVETTYSTLNNSPTYYIRTTYSIDVEPTPTSILYTGWALIDNVTRELIFASKINLQSNSSNKVVYSEQIYTQPDRNKGK